MEAYLVRTDGQVPEEMEGEIKRDSVACLTPQELSRSFRRRWVMLVGWEPRVGCSSAISGWTCRRSSSTGFAGGCSEPQPWKKLRCEEPVAVGFEVDAKTSVALERKT